MYILKKTNNDKIAAPVYPKDLSVLYHKNVLRFTCGSPLLCEDGVCLPQTLLHPLPVISAFCFLYEEK